MPISVYSTLMDHALNISFSISFMCNFLEAVLTLPWMRHYLKLLSREKLIQLFACLLRSVQFNYISLIQQLLQSGLCVCAFHKPGPWPLDKQPWQEETFSRTGWIKEDGAGIGEDRKRRKKYIHHKCKYEKLWYCRTSGIKAVHNNNSFSNFQHCKSTDTFWKQVLQSLFMWFILFWVIKEQGDDINSSCW